MTACCHFPRTQTHNNASTTLKRVGTTAYLLTYLLTCLRCVLVNFDSPLAPILSEPASEPLLEPLRKEPSNVVTSMLDRRRCVFLAIFRQLFALALLKRYNYPTPASGLR